MFNAPNSKSEKKSDSTIKAYAVQHEPETNQFYVLDENNNRVGYIIYSKNKTSTSFQLAKIEVEEKHRGKDIGTALLKTFSAHACQNKADIQIFAFDDAYPFYEKFYARNNIKIPPSTEKIFSNLQVYTINHDTLAKSFTKNNDAHISTKSHQANKF